MKYTIVGAMSTSELINDINRGIALGFVPYGYVFTKDEWFYQAMVKTEKEKEL